MDNFQMCHSSGKGEKGGEGRVQHKWPQDRRIMKGSQSSNHWSEWAADIKWRNLAKEKMVIRRCLVCGMSAVKEELHFNTIKPSFVTQIRLRYKIPFLAYSRLRAFHCFVIFPCWIMPSLPATFDPQTESESNFKFKKKSIWYEHGAFLITADMKITQNQGLEQRTFNLWHCVLTVTSQDKFRLCATQERRTLESLI